MRGRAALVRNITVEDTRLSILVHERRVRPGDMALAIVIKEGFTLLEGLRIIIFQPHQTLQITQLRLEALPSGLLSAKHSDSEGTYRDMGGLEPEELDFDEGQIEQVTCVKEDTGLVDIDGMTIVLEKCLGWRTVYVELDSLEDLVFHL